MTFDEAKLVAKPFGKYIGQTIDQIAETDEGLMHLDWLLDWFEGKPLVFIHFQEALAAYLADPAIKAELERLVR